MSSLPFARLPSDRVHFLIGAMKCGTTSLYASLKSHPAVCPGRVKEPQFFSHDPVFRRGPDWYRSQWPGWNPEIHAVALDATTSHAKAPCFRHSPRRIHQFNPTAKLIYLVRDPFERIQSHYRMSLAKDWYLLPLDQGVSPLALTISRYYFQLQRYREHFPKESILVIDLADLSENPERNLSRICDHLNIAGSAGLILDKRHSGEEYRAQCPESGAASERCILSGKNRNQILRSLEADMKNLQREYGIDVSRWGFH